jgi:oligopeptide transport system substrate-binding protein
VLGALFAATLALSCSNNPYPGSDDGKKVLYLPFETPPKTLDPAISYGTADTVVTNKVFDTLLEYHYLERPYRLMPSMAKNIPEPEKLEDGRVRYTFHLHPHIRFAPDACFRLSLGEAGAKTGRKATAQDFVFELQRIADPGISSPVIEPFSHLDGFREFREALNTLRKADKNFAKLRIDEQYAKAGEFRGAVAADDHTLVITLKDAYPQILYWFAMPFTTPVAWEAAQYYDGEEGRLPLGEHTVSTGAFVVTEYDKQARIVLEPNPNWWGLGGPNSLGERFPEVPEGSEWDDVRSSAGKKIPFLDRIEYRMEKESIPQFNKFLQGYYDFSGITRESFDKVIREGGLSPEMEKIGIQLEKGVEPGVYYLGFNMDDPAVGTAGGERSRALRQAMSLALNVEEYLRLFANGRGVLAQSPIPPGLFGYDESYRNPYRNFDIARAAQILKDAGLENGIDPATKKPLRLTFDVPDTSPEGRVRFMFWVNQWRKLGLNVELEATNYNQFYEKMIKGSYQIYTWGWMADYPDPENFLFLLSGPMARSRSGGPNNANFQNARYDELFQKMAYLENGEERRRIIHEMRGILETERPWIELFHPEAYALGHGWMKNVRPTGISTMAAAKYYDLDPKRRQQARAEWNEPVLWPAFVLFFVFLAVLAPGIVTYYKERS